MLDAANIPLTYSHLAVENFTRFVPELLGTDDVLFEWLLLGSRLVTIFGGVPDVRTALAVAILTQVAIRRDQPTSKQVFGYLHASRTFEEIVTHKFDGEATPYKEALLEPGLLVLANVDELTDAHYPYFLRCVAERCDRGVVTIFTTTAYCVNSMMTKYETIKSRMLCGRMVQI